MTSDLRTFGACVSLGVIFAVCVSSYAKTIAYWPLNKDTRNIAIEQSSETSSGELVSAGVSYRTSVIGRTFEPGVKLFTDRDYVLKEAPTSLRGKQFLCGSIDGIRAAVVTAGFLTICTPQVSQDKGQNSASQIQALEAMGFRRVTDTPIFQAFGDGPNERVLTYRKEVDAGENFNFGKWVIVVDIDPDHSGPSSVLGPSETLYNGVVLAKNVADRSEMAAYRDYPLPVPYLENPPTTIPVDVGRQLFVDDFLIENTTMTRTWHKAQKDARGPVLWPETPLEKGQLSGKDSPTESMAAPFSGGVWYDGRDGLYKCWYCAGWFDGTAYAYSSDGYAWIRPELKAVPGTNRIVAPTVVGGKRSYRDSAAVVMDPDETGGTRFKMLIWSRPQGGELFCSNDGLEWSKPVGCGANWGDRSTVFYNPFRRKWVYSIRSFWHDRSRSYVEVSDFLDGDKGGSPVEWLRADCRDQPERSWIYSEPTNFKEESKRASLYNFDAVAYESLVLGVFTLMTGADNDDCMAHNHPKMTELHLGFSRDGFHFSRSEDRSPFIGASRREGAWDRGYLHSNAGVCIVDGDRLRIYYTGFAGKTGEYADASYNGIYANASMGLAWLRRDGFASMDAGSGGGDLTTRTIVFNVGDQLYVNANAAGGELKVALLDEAGEVLKESATHNGNSTHMVVLSGLSEYAGTPVRLRFSAKEASIYSFWFSDENGGSRGYLAGGGVGKATLKDL